MSRRSPALVGIAVVSVALGAVVAGIAAGIAGFLFDSYAYQTAAFAVTLGLVAVGALRRQPENRAVQVSTAAACLMAIEVAALTVAGIVLAHTSGTPSPDAAFAGEVALGSLPLAAGIALWIEAWIWVPALFGFMTFGLLLFPDGTLPSRRWRVVTVVAALGIALIAGSNVVLAWPTRQVPYAFADFDATTPAVNVGFMLTIVATLGALASLFVRYRRAAGTETRHQIRWVLYGAATFALSFVPALVIALQIGNGDLPLYVSLITGPLLFAGYGVAITKYRLYDIDVVISRTLVFGLLAGFITAVYVAIVVGLGSLAGAGGEPNLALAILATALIAVAFEPLRARLQRWANRLVFGRRASPYEVLSNIAADLSAQSADENALDRLAALLADGTGASATVWLEVGGTMRPAATSREQSPTHDGPEPARTDPDDEDLTVPVEHDGVTLGVISLRASRGQSISPADEKLVRDVAGSTGLLVRNLRLNAELAARADELQRSRRRLVAAQDEARRSLERDLHDGAQQQVVAANVHAGLVRTIAKQEDHNEVGAAMDTVGARLQQTIDELRTIARGIYPPLLEAEGLEAAVRGAADALRSHVHVAAQDLGRYDRQTEATVYFCALEALRDAARRGAQDVSIHVEAQPDEVVLIVVDDGRPGPGDRARTALTDRSDASGGLLDLRTHEGRTTVRVRIPARARAHD